MAFAYYALFALVIAGADQLTKLLVVRGIPLHGYQAFLPGVLGLPGDAVAVRADFSGVHRSGVL